MSRKSVRSRLDQFIRPDGTPGARKSGGPWKISADALRIYCEERGGDEVQLMLLNRVIKRTCLAPKVPAVGPPPPWSEAIFEAPARQGSR
jgi:hypothetical protein